MGARMVVLLLGALGMTAGAGPSASAATLKPAALRCEALLSPSGVDSARPRLSWRLEAADPAARGLRQTAYRVLVASDRALLREGRADLWDSGRVEGGRQLGVEYAGKPLAARQLCWWTVRAWDQAGGPSVWASPARWSMGLLTAGDWSGRWIGASDRARGSGRMPIFRREFAARTGLRRAELFICGLGAYEARLNGRRIGIDLIEPGWTNYRSTCLYRAYDVTPMVRAGANALGVLLGNGMYNVQGGRYVKFTGTFGRPKLIAQLHLDYEDGSSEVVATDGHWQWSPGPITFSCIYGGEDHDARLERTGWDQPGGGAKGWSAALEEEGPGGRLVGASQSAPPVRVAAVIQPVRVTQPKPGVWVYDMGQNCSLVPRITVRGPAGSVVRITPGELLDGAGLVSQGSSGGPTSFSYTLAGRGREEWSPRFTYYGSRYLQLEGAEPGRPGLRAGVSVALKVEGLFVCGSAETVGEFSCSNTLFNRTAQIIAWAIRSNMMSLMTDCPHRERLGWLEQTHLMGASFMSLIDMRTVLAKMSSDMKEAQLENGLVPDIAPEYVVFGGGFRDSPEWGSAAVLVPWQLYTWYGDLEALRRAYPVMRRYIDYLSATAHGDIVSHGLGDWYDIGPNPPGGAQLTPTALTATAFYWQDMVIAAQTARLLGRPDEAAALEASAGRVRRAFNTRFYRADIGSYSTGSQAANAIPLAMGLCEPADRARVVESLVADIRSRGNALTAGDVGYRYVLRALAAAGRSDVVFDMNSRSDRPGYGWQLEHGATSLTEAWDSLASSSQNHFMLGHILEWFHRDLAGIQLAEDGVAYDRIVIRPQPVGDVKRARAALETPRGRISSEWRLGAEGFELRAAIPPNTAAEVFIPAAPGGRLLEGGRNAAERFGAAAIRREGAAWVVRVGSGSYLFTVPKEGSR